VEKQTGGRAVRVNKVRELIEQGTTVVNGWVSCESVYAAEVLSHSGYDTVTIDLQHGMFGLDGAVRLVQAVSAGPAVPMVRASALDAAEIGKLLDAGAYGVICPSIDSAAQCAALVAACRYPPVGRRSYGPARGLMYGGPDYLDRADETVQVWAMVESATALANLAEIVATPGLDGVYVGPNDLALSLGVTPATVPVAEEVTAALATILATAHSVGVAVGAYCADARMARQLADDGFDLVTPGNDVVLLRDGVTARLATIRGETRTGPAPSGY
jgi:4-hydroxy-2-oxoheptanedioate aldolase